MRVEDVPEVLELVAGVHAGPDYFLNELSRPWTRAWVSREGVSHDGASHDGASHDGASHDGASHDGAGGSAATAVRAYVVAWHVADEMHVLDVVTHPDARRRGHARALMDETLAYARREGVRAILLEVRRSNAPAIALYRALGFRSTRVRVRYYDDGEDAFEMALRLDAAGAVVASADEVEVT
jgi:ribosomal protein S18 acetylase RimI-like enzyme